ncbi:unnamed protein product [Pylaiella littoralis]
MSCCIRDLSGALPIGNETCLFGADPERYVPAYGGHCALAAAEGMAVSAQPDIFVTMGSRVFLFRSPAARYAFLLEAETLITRADSLWPDVVRTLSP